MSEPCFKPPKGTRFAKMMSIDVCDHGNVCINLEGEDGTPFACGVIPMEGLKTMVALAMARADLLAGKTGTRH